MIWMQSFARAIDLVNPTPDQVDFRDIARTLGHINRYAGATLWPVSVALHTLIACDAAPEPLKPWVLLHDAHEAYIGDITTPVVAALEAMEPPRRMGENMGHTIKFLKFIHDKAIHARAGLAMPTHAQARAIREADVIALQTERRDFLMPSPKPWHPLIEAIAPLPKSYRDKLPEWAPDAFASELCVRFERYLPPQAFRPFTAAPKPLKEPP